MKISAYFFGSPGSALDRSCRRIFALAGGKEIGSGTKLAGPATGECEVQYEVPDEETEHVKQRLIATGFRLSPTTAKRRKS